MCYDISMKEENYTQNLGNNFYTEDVRTLQYDEIAGTTVIETFDWTRGYDIEKELDASLIVKDQANSSSCGGQAWATYGEVLEAISTKTKEERSAKFIYAQTAVAGGGSDGLSNSKLVAKKGWGTEALTPSYPATEENLTRKTDITQKAYENALKARAGVYTQGSGLMDTIDIDEFALAIQKNHGAILGIAGYNNGTWLSYYPAPVTKQPWANYWRHWVYVGKAEMIDGKKGFWILNSWGKNCGKNGWQWLSEDWFSAKSSTGISLVWASFFLSYLPQEDWKHTFSLTLRKGSRNAEVKALQHALYLQGMFSDKEDGIFGNITLASVKAFQKRYSLVADGIVGKNTNNKLNSIYSQL